MGEKKRGKEKQENYNQKTVNKLAIVSPYVSTITLNISGLNSTIKRQNALH